MNRGIVCAAVLTLVLCVGCGDNTSSGVPSPKDPANPPTQTLPQRSTDQDSRLPDLSKSVAVRLATYANFQAISELYGEAVAPPLVGDPKLKLTLTATSGSKLNGSLLFFFEDDLGAAWMTQTSQQLPLVGYWGPEDPNNSSSQQILDIIFEDSAVVARVSATRSGNDLTGVLRYRVRGANDANVCVRRTATCQVIGTPPTPPPAECQPGYQDTLDQQDAASCRQYMSTSASQVKTLGTFQAKFSDWVNQ